MAGSPGMLMFTEQVMLKTPALLRDASRLLLLFVPLGLVTEVALIATFPKSLVQVNTLSTSSIVGTVATQVKRMSLKGGIFGRRISAGERKTDRLGAGKKKEHLSIKIKVQR